VLLALRHGRLRKQLVLRSSLEQPQWKVGDVLASAFADARIAVRVLMAQLLEEAQVALM
jgi:hypothetical protein